MSNQTARKASKLSDRTFALLMLHYHWPLEVGTVRVAATASLLIDIVTQKVS